MHPAVERLGSKFGLTFRQYDFAYVDGYRTGSWIQRGKDRTRNPFFRVILALGNGLDYKVWKWRSNWCVHQSPGVFLRCPLLVGRASVLESRWTCMRGGRRASVVWFIIGLECYHWKRVGQLQQNRWTGTAIAVFSRMQFQVGSLWYLAITIN